MHKTLLRIRRLGVRIPSGAQDHMALDLRICRSSADLFPSLLDVLVLLRCSSVTKPLVPPGPGEHRPVHTSPDLASLGVVKITGSLRKPADALLGLLRGHATRGRALQRRTPPGDYSECS